jgi:formylglycine-generating enzyme required for sulfatase activity
MNSPLSEQLTQELAEQKIERFVSRFEPSYEYLACHCALPLVLTPELVNYIRVQFLLSEEVPWIAEADLLLSELCHPVGYELYAMTPAVRSNLLNKFQNSEFEQKFGANRLKSVAQLLMDYVTYLMGIHPNIQAQLQAQQWAAMVYLDEHRTQAEQEIATALQALVNRGKNGQAELARLQRLIEEFRPQLSQHNSLREFAKSLGIWLKGQIPSNASQSYAVHGVKMRLPIPPNLQVFEYKTPTVNRRGEIINSDTKQAQYFIENLGNNVILEMVAIPGGKFLMGSPSTEAERYDDESPQHEVTVPPFFMGKYPVTQAQWRTVAALEQVNRELNPDPSNFKGDNLPVEQISWYEAVEFCARLSEHTGQHYRLPSEAEWEYACRAGTTTPFYFGETITADFASYNAEVTYADEPKGKSANQTTPVGSFLPNLFGLYDMHGNVWEWCYDHWHDNYEGAPAYGSPWIEAARKNLIENDNHSRLLRGGSWSNYPEGCRGANRYGNVPVSRNNYLGFRVVLVSA